MNEAKCIVVEAPSEYYGVEIRKRPSLFLAGGITGCSDWQSEMILNLSNELAIIYNPRRPNFSIDDPKAAEVQIAWEFDKLIKATIVSFWFAKGTDNPIVLYELGMHGNSQPDRPIIIGIDEGYSRAKDVVIQTQLSRPEVSIFQGSFQIFSNQVKYALRVLLKSEE